MNDQEKTKAQLIEELAQLRHREAKWRSVAENAPLFVAVVDRSGTMQFLNRYQPGFEPASVLGRRIYDFLQPQYHAVAQDCLERVFEAGEATSYESVGAGPDGTLSDYVTDVGPVIVDGETIAVTLIARDITQQKRTEQALQASEERYRTLIESIPQTVWRTDPDGNLLDCNRHWYEYTGQTPDEAKGTGWSQAVHPDDLARVGERVREDLARGERYQCEQRLRRASDGSYRWHLAAGVPVKDQEGRITGWIGSTTDIHDQKCAEEVLQRAHDELERKVKERTADLSTANERLGVFQQFAEASGQGFSMADLDGRLLYLNPALCRMLGIEGPEGYLGQHLSVCYAEEANRRGREEIEPNLNQHGRWEGELPLLSRQGVPISTWHHAFVIRDANGRPLRMAVVITDITERKQAEEALRQSHDELRAIYEGMQDGLLIADVETKQFVRCNAAIRHMLEYSEEELLARSVLDIHPAEEGPRVLERFHTIAEGEKTVTTDIPVLRSDGSIFYADINHHEITYNGRHCSVGVFRDITERKRAEEALRQSERRFRNYFEQGLIGMAVTSVDKRWLEVNDRLCEILGYRREDLIRTNWVALTHPDDLEPNSRLFDSLLAGDITFFTLDKRYIRKDGGIVYTTIHTRAFRKDDGTIDHIVTLIEDITARKQVEEALRRSEERYELAVQGAGVGIWDYDVRGGKLYFTPRWKELFGYADREMGESLEDWTRLLHPEERDWVVKFLEDFLAGADPTVTVEYRLRHGDGSYRWIAAHAVVVRDEQGKAIRVVGSHGDITDRKRAEEALQREHRTLEHMLKASDHERQLIAYDIHDGLAQYLTGAIMQFEHSHNIRERSEDSETAYKAGMEMLRHSHFEARRLISGVRPPILDESGVIAAISHLIHDPAYEHGPKVAFQSKVAFMRLPPVVENVIYRIVQEGLNNARNHSKSKRIVVRLLQRDDDLRIAIRDWGIGFDPKKVDGNRFGLEGIRERARLLGGRCSIKSQPGVGTAVLVELPIREERHE